MPEKRIAPQSKVRDRSTVFKIGQIVLGRYEVLRTLSATGGMSNVYLVRDTSLGRTWVLKQILNPELREGLVTRREMSRLRTEYQALQREANIMKSLEHQGIPRITSIERDDSTGSSYIVMDYINGRNMLSFLRDNQIPKISVTVTWMKQLCIILGYLHNLPRPILYRDLKPANIMISQERVHLIDFGTAEVISMDHRYPDRAMGTPGYTAPEQTNRANEMTLQSDIFGLGATMYHMLTGKAPSFAYPELSENGEQVFDENGREVKKPPVQPQSGPYDVRVFNRDVPRGLVEIVKKCTEPDPSMRYQKIEEVLEALDSYKTFEKSYRKKLRRRVQLPVTLMVGGAVLMAGSLLPLSYNHYQSGQYYNDAISVASQSGNVDDYVRAIEMRPEALGPYNGLIEAIKRDGEFSTKEETQLLGLINPHITTISEEEGWPELAYNIGRLYWFYYQGTPNTTGEQQDGDSEAQGQAQSTKWFKSAVDGGYNPKGLAQVYYDIGQFNSTISGAVAESNDAGLYKKYWDNLNTASEQENGEVVDLQILNTYANCINNYSYRLRTDGVPREQVEAKIQQINNYLDSNSPSPGTPTTLYDELKNNSTDLQSKVDLAYKEA